MARILVTDDDRPLRKLISHQLRKAGHEAITCSDGSRAIALIEDNDDFDLLITDMQMPVMDGRELIIELHNRKDLSVPPIIIMSAVVSQAQVQDLLKLGAARFVAKPVKRAALLEYVSTLTAGTCNPEDLPLLSPIPST